MQDQMKNNTHYSIEARRDLEDIWDYIESDLGNPGAAKRMVNRIMDDVDRLEAFSGLGAPLSSIIDSDTDYRYLVTGNYMTFYRVYGTDIYVDRILYARRDYLRVLFSNEIEPEIQ